MRVLFILLLLVGFCFSEADAQRELDVTYDGTDTITNAETETKSLGLVKKFGDLYYHVYCDSLSGTPAGTIYWEWSIDGSNWAVAATDTITNAAVTNQDHAISNFAGKYARIRIVSTGTQSVKISGGGISFKQKL